jgi:hypothetical protein
MCGSKHLSTYLYLSTTEMLNAFLFSLAPEERKTCVHDAGATVRAMDFFFLFSAFVESQHFLKKPFC